MTSDDQRVGRGLGVGHPHHHTNSSHYCTCACRDGHRTPPQDNSHGNPTCGIVFAVNPPTLLPCLRIQLIISGLALIGVRCGVQWACWRGSDAPAVRADRHSLPPTLSAIDRRLICLERRYPGTASAALGSEMQMRTPGSCLIYILMAAGCSLCLEAVRTVISGTYTALAV
jgi:hypothetical protein